MNPRLFCVIHDTRKNAALSQVLTEMSLSCRLASARALIAQLGGIEDLPLYIRIVADAPLVSPMSEIQGEVTGTLELWEPISRLGHVRVCGRDTGGQQHSLRVIALAHDKVQTSEGIYRLGTPASHDAAQWHAALQGSRFVTQHQFAQGQALSVMYQGGLYPGRIEKRDGPDWIIRRLSADGEVRQESTSGSLLPR